MKGRHFHFIRHARTDYNLENRYTGNHDVSICEEQEICTKSYSFFDDLDRTTSVISSPMIRALQTIKMLQTNKKIKIQIAEGLKERNFGVMNGKKKVCYQKKYFYKGETSYQFKRRVLREFRQTTRKYDKFVIISHSGVYKVLYQYLKHLNPHLKERTDNLELSKFNF